MKVDAFKDAYKKKFEDMFAVPYTSGSTTEQFQALGQLLRSIYTDKWVHTIIVALWLVFLHNT